MKKNEQILVTFTVDNLADIRDAANPTSPPMTNFFAMMFMVWNFILGGPIPDNLDPMAYAIPEDQWQEIAEMLATCVKPLGAETQVAALFEWINKAPSSFRINTPSPTLKTREANNG